MWLEATLWDTTFPSLQKVRLEGTAPESLSITPGVGRDFKWLRERFHEDSELEEILKIQIHLFYFIDEETEAQRRSHT